MLGVAEPEVSSTGVGEILPRDRRGHKHQQWILDSGPPTREGALARATAPASPQGEEGGPEGGPQAEAAAHSCSQWVQGHAPWLQPAVHSCGGPEGGGAAQACYRPETQAGYRQEGGYRG